MYLVHAFFLSDLLFDFIWIKSRSTTSLYCLNHVSDLCIELDVGRLPLSDHDRVDQLEVKDGQELLRGRLEKGKPNIPDRVFGWAIEVG